MQGDDHDSNTVYNMCDQEITDEKAFIKIYKSFVFQIIYTYDNQGEVISSLIRIIDFDNQIDIYQEQIKGEVTQVEVLRNSILLVLADDRLFIELVEKKDDEKI